MAKDAKTKAKAKRLHGEGRSERDIAGLTGATRPTVKGWIDKWEATGFPKGYLQPELDQKERDSALSAAERAGLTKALIAGKVVELIHSRSLAVITTQGAVSLAPMLPDAEVTGGKADLMGIQYDVVPDRRTQMEATKLGADILGMKKSDQESERTNDNLLTLIRSMRPK